MTASRLGFTLAVGVFAVAFVFVAGVGYDPEQQATLAQAGTRATPGADPNDGVPQPTAADPDDSGNPNGDVTPEPAEPEGPREVFVAPGADGTGTIDDPAGLAETLASRTMPPGSTIYLRGGTYVGFFTSDLVGTAAEPIVVRPFMDERAVIDGFGTDPLDAEALNIGGAHTRFIGLEITNSEPSRERIEPGSLGRAGLVQVFGDSIGLIGNLIHDGGSCVGVWSVAEAAEIHGNVIYNCGWQGPDRGHGHGLYVQNDGGPVRIDGNIIIDNFGYGIHAFATNGQVSNLRIADNIVAGASALADGGAGIGDGDAREVLVGAGTPVENITFEANTVVGLAPVQFGYTNPDNTGLVVRGNRLVGTGDGPSLVIRNWTDVTGEDNVIFTAAGAPVQILETEFTRWDDNHYYGNDLFPGGTFATWQQPDRDLLSSQSLDPPADSVVVVPNRYDDDRAFVAVLNWSGAAAIEVDLSEILEPGDGFEIRNAQNLDAEPIVTGTFEGGAVVVPLSGMTARLPVGMDRPAKTSDIFRALSVTSVSDTGTPDEPQDPGDDQ